MDLPPNEDARELRRCYSSGVTSESSPPPTNKEDVAPSTKSPQQNIVAMKNPRAADIKALVNKAMEALTKSSGTQQLVIGSVSGWTAGYLTMKVGRPAAFGIGGGIILFQIAQQQRLVQADWDKVKQKIEPTKKQYNSKIPGWTANMTKYARANTGFAAGFVGGFLIGLAS